MGLVHIGVKTFMRHLGVNICYSNCPFAALAEVYLGIILEMIVRAIEMDKH